MSTEQYAVDKRDFTIFDFKMRFGRIFHILTASWLLADEGNVLFWGTTALNKNYILRSPRNNLTITLKIPGVIFHRIWLRLEICYWMSTKACNHNGFIHKKILKLIPRNRIQHVLSETRGGWLFRDKSHKANDELNLSNFGWFWMLTQFVKNKPTHVWYVLQIFVYSAD